LGDELFVVSKPKVSLFRVFGCPCIAKKWKNLVNGKPEDDSKGAHRGIRGIHLGFSPTQKGWLLYVLFNTRQIFITRDEICDETFASAVAETSFIPDPYTIIEHAGDLLSQFEEVNTAVQGDQTATAFPYDEDIIHSDLISDPITDNKEVSSEEENTTEESVEDISAGVIPQTPDDGLDSNTRRSTRTRNPPKLVTFSDFQADRKWQEMANNVFDIQNT
jgi:hypothetical protein